MDTKKKEVFYNKLTYIYVELANFNLEIEQCKTILDKWLFCLKNLSRLLERPAELQGRVFEKLFKTAEIAKFKPMELKAYEQSINAYRDIKNGMDSAKEEGIKQGLKQGLKQGMDIGGKRTAEAIAKKMKLKGLPIDFIRETTGLSEEAIQRL